MFKWDGERIIKALRQEENTLIANENLRIQIPKRFAKRKLASVGLKTYICCIYAIITDDDKYDISNLPIIGMITPTRTSEVKIEDVEYYEFYFPKNSIIMPNVNLVRRDTLMYNVFDELIYKGNVPWYMMPDDVARISDHAKEVADSAIGEYLTMTEIISSLIARDAIDKKIYYRNTNRKNKFEFIALGNVFYSATSTMSKLAGNYFADGVVGAIVEQTDESSRVEDIIRT